ncbi:MAG: NAD(P)/FAD-dependent oxidoreductase [Anaerolineae bacterium]|nr:NAD(P)/FAD-dependent oxidoreductase [Anaerolineae bacterium]
MKQEIKGHHVVIVGGGFGGLKAAKALQRKAVRVTLVDKRNFHLFQPLLYQVATGGLSPGDIAYPLRAAVAGAKNIEVLAAEVVDILPDERRIVLRDGQLTYDMLIVATGATHHYFGNDQWGELAPGLKTVEDALAIRRKILLSFEAAERETDPARRRAWLNFVVVGGGPTGVELAGAIAGLARETMVNDFRHIDPREARIILLEGTDRVLNTFPEELSLKAENALFKRGIEVRKKTFLTDIDEGSVLLQDAISGDITRLPTFTVLWAAGTKASSVGQMLAERAGVALDRMGRVMVEPELTLPGYPNVFVIGDLAHFADQLDAPLPGVAQVAMQQGVYAAKVVLARLAGKESAPFHYADKGTMAVIGRNAAVADLGPLHMNGFLAWLVWLFIHISFLIGFDNKLQVLIQWAWYYLTRKRGARLITGEDPYPLV